MYTYYAGVYNNPQFSGTGTIGMGTMPYTVPAGQGCFVMVLEQPVGGTAGQVRRALQQAGVPDNAFGDGEPNLTTDNYNEMLIDDGPLASLTIDNLSTSGGGTGNGTFSFKASGGTGSIVNGTITIQSSASTSGPPESDYRKVNALVRRLWTARARRFGRP